MSLDFVIKKLELIDKEEREKLRREKERLEHELERFKESLEKRRSSWLERMKKRLEPRVRVRRGRGRGIKLDKKTKEELVEIAVKSLLMVE